MEHKRLINLFITIFEVSNIRWAAQVPVAKKLLALYNFEELDYALRYYKLRGVNMYSLAYLLAKDVMVNPVSLYKAEQVISLQDGNSGQRNNDKCARKNNETNFGKEHYFDLFEESE